MIEACMEGRGEGDDDLAWMLHDSVVFDSSLPYLSR
jgi:hypothetical protein